MKSLNGLSLIMGTLLAAFAVPGALHAENINSDPQNGLSLPAALPDSLDDYSLPEDGASDILQGLPVQDMDDDDGMLVPDAEDLLYEDEIIDDENAEDSLPLEIRVSSDNNDYKLPNPEYEIEDVQVRGNLQNSPEHVIKLMGIKPGAAATLDELESARIRLALCGAFEAVEMALRPGNSRGKLIIVLYVKERSPLQINQYYIGSGKKAPFWLGLDVTWLAPFATSHRMRMAFAATSADDYTFSLGYLIPSIASLPISLMFGVESMVSHEEVFNNYSPILGEFKPVKPTEYLGDLDFRRDGAHIGVGYAPVSGLRLMLRLEYMSLSASNDQSLENIQTEHFIKSGQSNLSALSFNVAWDTRNGREMPSSGHFLMFGLKGSFESKISDYSFLRASLFHQSNWEVADGHVLRLQTAAGIVTPDAPFFEKFFYNDFYSLSTSRIHFMNPESRGAYDIFKTGASDLSYEDYLVHAAVTYAWQAWTREFEIFATVGATWADSFDLPPLALGVRPEHQRESFPVDLSVDAGIRFRSPYGLFTFTLSRFFDLIAR